MADILSRKRSATDQSGQGSQSDGGCKLYNGLISILSKALTQSRAKIASDAPQTIKDSYGEMTSLFTSSEDSDGVSSLVDLLLGKLDSVHDRFNAERKSSVSASDISNSSTRLEKLLQEQNIVQLLEKVEAAINDVEKSEEEFNKAEEADRNSAKEAIKMAKSTRISPSGKKRRVLPAESIGYHAHKLKVDYQKSLVKELEEIEKENDKLEEELKDRWGEWQKNVEEVKSAIDTLDSLGGGNENGEDGGAGN